MNEQMDRELYVFKKLCDEAICDKYILADIKLMKLLQYVADTPILLEEVQRCLEGFNYQYEFMKAKLPTEGCENEECPKFNLPIEPTRRVALLFRILYDIDAKIINTMNFMNEFYNVSDDPDSNYWEFSNSIIKPFKESLIYLVTGVEAITAPEIVVYPTEVKIKERLLLDIVELVKKNHTIIVSEDLPEEVLYEMEVMGNGLINTITTKDPKQVFISWIGYKNTVKDCKKITATLKKMEDKLRNSGLFDAK